MKRKTEKQLFREWWWRHPNSMFKFDALKHTTKSPIGQPPMPEIDGQPLPVWPLWKDGTEWAAYSYELVRRSSGNGLLPPWTKLNGSEHYFLRRLFGKANMLWVNSSEPQPGHTDACYWNLALSDGALRAAFLGWVAEQREKHGIRAPRGRKGQSSKGPSWLWPEMMDLAANGFRKHPTFDSGTLSRAQHLAGDLAQKFRAALEAEKDRRNLWPKIVSCIECPILK